MSESEVNRLLTNLYTHRIDAKKELQPDGNWSLSVPDEQRVEALQLLDQKRLIRTHEQNGSESRSMISSREEQRFQYERNLAQEIERTLMRLDPVLDARVHLNLIPLDPIFGQPVSKNTGSASVMLVVAHSDGIEINQIEKLVAGASGIPSAQVSVLISSSQPIREESENALVASESSHTERRNAVSSISKSEFKFATVVLACGVVGFGIFMLTRSRKDKGGAVGKVALQFES